MWTEMARIIHEVQPRYAFVENSPMLTSRGLGRVLGDLATMGFDARWGVLGAKDIGANHQRDRIWIKATNVSNSSEIRRSWEHGIQTDGCSASINGERHAENAEESTNVGEVQELAYTNSTHGKGNERTQRTQAQYADINSTSELVNANSQRYMREENKVCTRGNPAEYASWWQSEPDVGRVANGVAARVDRLKAIGNGQVPLCAATAWRVLSDHQPKD